MIFMEREITRRRLLQGLGAVLAPAALTRTARAAQAPPPAALTPYSASVLPTGIRSRFVQNVNGITMHVLEAGYETPGRQGVLMIHGYPELAYSWRKVMLPLAAAGFHVFAPDVRGYGRTSGTDVKFDDDLRPFGTLNRISDMVGLVSAFGYRSVAAVIGHDQGSPLAGWCATAQAGHLPLGRDDERAVWRTADRRVQHRECRATDGSARRESGPDLRRARRAEPAAQALSAVLPDARGQREHVASAAGHPRLPARVLPHEERGLGARTNRSA